MTRLRTAVALLFSPAADAVGALAEQILSADRADLLARALARLPEATRRAACHQAAVQAAAVTGLAARISAGRLVAFDAGRCDAIVTLAIQGTNAAARRAHLDLAAITPANLGFRLLPARAYAIAQEIEESAEQLTYRRPS